MLLFSPEYVISLAAACLYAVSMLFVRQALNHGAGLMRTTFILSWLMVLLFAPLLLIECSVNDWSLVWTPAIVGLCLFLAQIAVFGALRFGDASIQTPVMGVKAFMVAVFATMLGVGHIPWTWWLGSGLTIVAIYLLSYSDGCPILKKSNLKTILLAFISASLFGLGEVIMEKYAPRFGEMVFLELSMLSAALLSCLLVPFFEGKLLNIPALARTALWVGTLLYALEAMGFYIAISFYGNATAVNILYSSRGLWSVACMWLWGQVIGGGQTPMSHAIMRRRLIGAALIFASITSVILP